MDDVIEPDQENLPAVSLTAAETSVRHFRQILLWPVYLTTTERADIPDYAQHLLNASPVSSWFEVEDEFTDDPADFKERHYNEFVAFLPSVQRFLYGQGKGGATRQGYGDSPIRVLRRSDIHRVRVQLSPDSPALLFNVAHVDLYFFFDIDLAVLALEIHTDELPLAQAQEVMFQFGRAYPSYWEEDGRAGNCPWRVDWLDASDQVLATSDYGDRRKYLEFTARHRAPCVAAHWEYLLRPLALDHGDQAGPVRYRQLEYYRMPLMAYLSFTDPSQVSQADVERLAMAAGSGQEDRKRPKRKRYARFEAENGAVRFREIRDGQNSGTRYLSSGRTLVVTGDANNEFFTHLEHGTLSRFRHQDFLLFLIAHFHRAALLMFSDRLAEAVGRLDIRDSHAVQAFRSATREALETFLRFTHRYWFSEVSDDAETADLFELCRRHLGVDRLHADIRQEVQDMNQYLESEAVRRQNETVVRLTVVTIFGLIGTVVTGFLGMNLFAYADEAPLTKLALFFVVSIPTALLTLYTVRLSRRLSEFLDALSAEKWSFTAMAKALGGRRRE
jgi:hypothetical protein